MAALYEKYIEQGRAGGQVVLSHCLPEEQREIARFLGRSLPPSDTLTVRLVDFQQALARSSFACDLPALLLALFPERPALTRPEQRERQLSHQQRFSAEIAALFEAQPAGSRGQDWLLHGRHGRDALVRQHKNEPEHVQQEFLTFLRGVLQGLAHLPGPASFQTLSHFALAVSGDPHFFDFDTASGRLFLSALADLHELAGAENSNEQSEGEGPGPAGRTAAQDSWRHLLYYEVGLLLDTISSTVAVFHLYEAQSHDGAVDACVAHAGARVLVLPLRQLLAWKKLWSASQRVYLFENPQVFEVVVDELQKDHHLPEQELPTLVCTSGWPGVAVIRFLNLLTESSPDVQLYYSGDFDLQGLRIARYLLARYPRQCHLWRFDPQAYRVALHSQGVVLESDEMAALAKLPAAFSELVSVMQQERRRAFQEGITPLLMDDIRGA
jgi:uncharacterized protein (TIGR02679 family)